MKHTRPVIAGLLGLLLAPLLVAQGTAPRTEQGNLIFDGIPPRDPAISAQLARWLEARSTGLVDWLADGSLLISSRLGNTVQLHRVRAPLDAREQLTFEAEPVSTAAAHPYDPNALIFLKDQGGDENTQFFLRNLATGSDKLLTDGKSRNGPPVFAHDGKRVAFYSNARDGASFDVYLRDTTGDAAPQLLVAGGNDALYVQDWSLDDRRLAIIRYTSITDSQLLLVDVATGALTRVEPTGALDGPVSVTQARFARDGHGLYFLSDRGGEFTALHYLDLQTNALRTLTPDTRWDVERFALSLDGRFVAYTRNEASADRLVLYDVTRKVDLLLPPLPAGAVIGGIGFEHGSRQLAVAVQNAQSPQDVYVYRIEPVANDAAALPAITLVRWTQNEFDPIAASPVPAQLVEFPTWDRVGNQQRLLSAFVFKPRTPGPHPVLIDIHGGPESQYRPKWDAFTQYLVNELGYAVVAPNVRGSAGYGRSFLALDDGALREDAVRDIGALLVWIGAQPDFNRKRVVAMGGSYGGYMTLASLVNYGDRLAGGVDVVGISNFVTFLTNTSAYRRDLRRVEYGDERDPKMRALLQSISPLNNAASIRKPLLIVQGLNDPRVPASESAQMMAKVRANGGEVWYLAAKDEGHGFRKQANRDAYLATVVAFLQRIAAP